MERYKKYSVRSKGLGFNRQAGKSGPTKHYIIINGKVVGHRFDTGVVVLYPQRSYNVAELV